MNADTKKQPKQPKIKADTKSLFEMSKNLLNEANSLEPIKEEPKQMVQKHVAKKVHKNKEQKKITPVAPIDKT